MPTITIVTETGMQKIEVNSGDNLRETLLAHGVSPYTSVTRRLNCGGRGLCATCGVWIDEAAPAPEHWHDRLAADFGYPRLSCQITVETDMTIRLVEDKVIWGGRDAQRARYFRSG